ncbi:MAG: STAS domain-containing protein [Opitutaceae bacterium]|nr:STAS domain-containing protein [Cytophagales bacterium]
MKFSLDKQEKYTIISLEEDKLDSTISPLLKSEFITLNAEGNRNFILDLSKVRFSDSSGLSAILVANRLCTGLEGIFILTGLTDHVSKLIKISQLDTVLTILPTVAEAVDNVFMHELERNLKNEG